MFAEVPSFACVLLMFAQAGQIHVISSTPVFGVIRDVIPFRVTGAAIDHVLSLIHI